MLKPEHLRRVFNDFLGMNLRDVSSGCCPFLLADRLASDCLSCLCGWLGAQKQLQAVLDQIDINDDGKVVLQDLWKSTVRTQSVSLRSLIKGAVVLCD